MPFSGQALVAELDESTSVASALSGADHVAVAASDLSLGYLLGQSGWRATIDNHSGNIGTLLTSYVVEGKCTDIGLATIYARMFLQVAHDEHSSSIGSQLSVELTVGPVVRSSSTPDSTAIGAARVIA